MVSKSPLKTILGVILALSLVAALLYTYNGEKSLKSDIKENNEKIDALEKEKELYFNLLRQDSITIKRQDSIIIRLRREQILVLDSIKNARNDFKEIKRDYLNSSINERVGIFAKLATENN